MPRRPQRTDKQHPRHRGQSAFTRRTRAASSALSPSAMRRSGHAVVALGGAVVVSATVTASAGPVVPETSQTRDHSSPSHAAADKSLRRGREERASRDTARTKLKLRRDIAAPDGDQDEWSEVDPPEQTGPPPGSRQAPAPGAAGVGPVEEPEEEPVEMPEDPREIARVLVSQHGWDSGEFECLDALYESESGWDHTATNPYSGAYGIPQALPPEKMAAAGEDWRENPETQIEWGLDYIEESYGTPCSAWSFKQANNWY